MEHTRDIELIEMASGQLDAGRVKAVKAHLEACPACRRRHQEIQTTWEILGAWKLNPSERPEGIPRKTGVYEPPRRARTVRFPPVGVALRVAASIFFAALAGYAGGHWSVRTVEQRNGDRAPQYLSVLGLEVGESFSSLVLQDEISDRGDG